MGGDNSTMGYRRILPMDGARNFRDLGGYAAADGKILRWGRIYRSSALNELTQHDHDLIRGIGVHTVIDLRTAGELVKEPDLLPQDMDIRYLHVDIENSITQATGRDPIQSLRELVMNPDKKDALMGRFYTEMFLLGSSLFAKIFEALLEERGAPLIFHCKAGKDRAGAVAALILLALGVDEQTVIEDYMVSGIVWQTDDRETEKLAELFGIPTASLKDLMGTEECWIRNGLTAITAEYGSYDNYLEKAIGLDNKKLKRLKALYTE